MTNIIIILMEELLVIKKMRILFKKGENFYMVWYKVYTFLDPIGLAYWSEIITSIRLSGSAANRLLARGCNQDFHPSKFSVGRFCHTEIARIPVIIFQRDDRNDFDIYVDRSLAMDAWLWLRDTAREMT